MRHSSIKQCASIGSVLILLKVITPLSGSPQCQSENDKIAIDWNETKNAIALFVKEPSSAHAKGILSTLPKDVVKSIKGNPSFATEILWSHSSVLERMVFSGDRYSAEVAFRLLNFSDGALSEWLAGLVADLSGKRPELYLELLREYKETSYFKNAHFPLLETSNEADPRNVIIAAWESRIKGLETVGDQTLLALRDECIEILSRELSSARDLEYQAREYKDIYDFLELLRFTANWEQGFNLQDAPNWDISKVSQYVWTEGVEFFDTRDHLRTKFLYADIQDQMKSRRGKVFYLLSYLGYVYAFPWIQFTEMRFKTTNYGVELTISDYFMLGFKKEAGHYFLINCVLMKLAVD